MIKNPTGNIRKAYNPKLTILVVEDYTVFSKLVRHALPDEEVVCVGSLAEGKAAYDTYLPDMTFLDISLPDGTGHQLLDYIHAKESEAYVVMMTASKLEVDRDLSYLHGAQAYMTKPCSHEDVRKQAENYLVYRQELIEGLIRQGTHKIT